jgi:integrative and conjugative element protein (TIGR02256 family)
MSGALIFHLEDPFRLIEFAPSARNKLWRYRQTSANASEAGGVLLGARRGPHFQITAATSPQRRDKRSRYGFIRVARAHLPLALRHWRKTCRKEGYVGEWHSHPEKRPLPSFVDRTGWYLLVKQARRPLVQVILGTGSISVWYCDLAGGIHQGSQLP